MRIYYILLALLGLAYVLLHPQSDRLPQAGLSATASETGRKGRIAYAMLCALLIAFVAGLRAASVGVDTAQYQWRYLHAESMLPASIFDTIAYRAEVGYTLLNALFYRLGFPWQVFLFGVSLATAAGIVYYFHRYSKSVFLSVFVYITVGLFTMSMSGIRQMLAVALCMVALVVLHRGKRAWFVGLVAAATLLHNSAAVFLPMLLLANVRLSKSRVLLATAGALLPLVVSAPFVDVLEFLRPERYSGVSLDTGYAMNPLLIAVALAVLLFCAFTNRDRDPLTGAFDQATSALFVMSTLNLLFVTLGFANSQVARLSYYFVAANAVLIPNSLAGISDRFLRAAVYLGIVGLCAAYFIISTPGGTLQIDNYLFFWQT